MYENGIVIGPYSLLDKDKCVIETSLSKLAKDWGILKIHLLLEIQRSI